MSQNNAGVGQGSNGRRPTVTAKVMIPACGRWRGRVNPCPSGCWGMVSGTVGYDGVRVARRVIEEGMEAASRDRRCPVKAPVSGDPAAVFSMDGINLYRFLYRF